MLPGGRVSLSDPPPSLSRLGKNTTTSKNKNSPEQYKKISIHIKNPFESADHAVDGNSVSVSLGTCTKDLGRTKLRINITFEEKTTVSPGYMPTYLDKYPV